MGSCTHIQKSLFKIGKSPVIAGAYYEYEDYVAENLAKLGLTLCASKSHIYEIAPITILKGFDDSCLHRHEQLDYPGDHYILLDIPDGGHPLYKKEFWTDLIVYIKTYVGNKTTYVHCMGGHGRTGLILAILAYLSGATKNNPIEWIREKYCDHAVETNSQISYINWVLGKKFNAEPSKSLYQPIVYTNTTYQPKTNPVPFAGLTTTEKDLLLDSTAELYERMLGGDEASASLWKDTMVYWKTVQPQGYQTAWGAYLGMEWDIAKESLEEAKQIAILEYQAINECPDLMDAEGGTDDTRTPDYDPTKK